MKITIEVDPKTDATPAFVTSDSIPGYAGGEPQGIDPTSSNTGMTAGTTSGDYPAGEPPVWLLEAIENAPSPSTTVAPMGTSGGTARLE